MKKLILFTSIAALVFYACKSYKLTHHTTQALLKNKEVLSAFKNYNVYVHDKNNSYYLESPAISPEGVSGYLFPISDSSIISEIKNPGSQKEKDKHKFDVNFYTDRSISHQRLASTDNENKLNASLNANDNLVIKNEDITDITITALDKKRGFGKTLAIGLVSVVLALLTILLVVAIGASASKGSSNSSGGSNSGNSNSGGSSGSSGNGGKGSCYVATMVYGDYDAPEVMVLRKFRDEVLSASLGGRLFIKYYYKYSPGFVERFKNHKNINNLIKIILNKWVNYLSKEKPA